MFILERRSFLLVTFEQAMLFLIILSFNCKGLTSLKNDGLQIVYKWPYIPSQIDKQQHLLLQDHC